MKPSLQAYANRGKRPAVRHRSVMVVSTLHKAALRPIRTRFFVGLLALSWVSAAISPAYADHAGDIQAYANIASPVIMADQMCRDIVAVEDGLAKLRKASGITERDEPAVEQALSNAAEDVRRAYERDDSKVWCAGAWERFGPRGTQAPGLLRKG